MTEAEKDARIATLESTLKKVWGTHVQPYLLDPTWGEKFIPLDREIRALGVLP